jgi:hypothetical protein
MYTKHATVDMCRSNSKCDLVELRFSHGEIELLALNNPSMSQYIVLDASL